MTATIATTNALASDPIGGLLTSDGTIVYYLTKCCGASGKGSAGSYTGVVCRACYDVVPAALGNGWLVTDDAGWKRYADDLRPHLERFTDDMVAKVRAAAEARAVTHRGEVARVPGGNHGYPWRAQCSCGWQSRGYVAKHAAQAMLDHHTAG